jgi:hypothetical protein
MHALQLGLNLGLLMRGQDPLNCNGRRVGFRLGWILGLLALLGVWMLLVVVGVPSHSRTGTFQHLRPIERILQHQVHRAGARLRKRLPRLHDHTIRVD